MRKPTKRETFLFLAFIASALLFYRILHPPKIIFGDPRSLRCEDVDEKIYMDSAHGEILGDLNEDENGTRNRTTGELAVLFIGNSHTSVHNIPGLFSRIVEASGRVPKVKTGIVSYGGYGLPTHWNDGNALRAIRKAKWDYVILQGQSGSSVFCSKQMSDAVGLFAREIRGMGAEPILYMTWVRADILGTQEAWTASYLLTGHKFGIRVAPAGYA